MNACIHKIIAKVQINTFLNKIFEYFIFQRIIKTINQLFIFIAFLFYFIYFISYFFVLFIYIVLSKIRHLALICLCLIAIFLFLCLICRKNERRCPSSMISNLKLWTLLLPNSHLISDLLGNFHFVSSGSSEWISYLQCLSNKDASMLLRQLYGVMAISATSFSINLPTSNLAYQIKDQLTLNHILYS